MSSVPNYALPDFSKGVEFDSDASRIGIGVLSQYGQPSAYFGKKFVMLGSNDLLVLRNFMQLFKH